MLGIEAELTPAAVSLHHCPVEALRCFGGGSLPRGVTLSFSCVFLKPGLRPTLRRWAGCRSFARMAATWRVQESEAPLHVSCGIETRGHLRASAVDAALDDRQRAGSDGVLMHAKVIGFGRYANARTA